MNQSLVVKKFTFNKIPWVFESIPSRAVILFCILILTTFASISCAQGSYPVDFFYEMHYHPSYHPQEPPRLSPPESAVPITGKEVPLTVDDIATLVNPIPEEMIDKGKFLYEINCAMCHGLSGTGDGTVLGLMINKYNYEPKLPPDLTTVKGYPDGFLYGIISNRDLILTDPNQHKVMPQFQKLLTPTERWAIVNYIRSDDFGN